MASLPIENTPPSSIENERNSLLPLPRYAPVSHGQGDVTTDSAGPHSQESSQANSSVINHTSTNNSNTPTGNTATIPVKYKDFETRSARKRSYRNWPEREKQSPDKMADAGFYYTQNADSVRCFHCGIGLRNWERDDDPWVEHARWSKNCPFVLRKKGQAFIELVQEAVRKQHLQQALRENNEQANLPDLTPDCPPPSADNVRSTSSALASQQASAFPSDMERKNPLLCDAAQSVLSMGYLPRVIKVAVDEVLKLEGWSGMNGAAILKTILDKEENGEIDKESSMIPSMRQSSAVKVDPKSGQNERRLKNENQEMKEKMMCKMCFENRVSIVILPCGHLVSCAQCAPALKQCPICRSQMKATVRVSFNRD